MTSHHAEQLGKHGLAGRLARSLLFSYNLIDTLRRREVEALGEKLATEILRTDPSRVLTGSLATEISFGPCLTERLDKALGKGENLPLFSRLIRLLNGDGILPSLDSSVIIPQWYGFPPNPRLT